MRIALTGNPNSGKTTMFNALTGCNEKVGRNYSNFRKLYVTLYLLYHIAIICGIILLFFIIGVFGSEHKWRKLCLI